MIERIKFYMSGSRHFEHMEDALDEVAAQPHCVARPHNDGTWSIYYLVTGAVQPGQREFMLSEREYNSLVLTN